MVKFLEPEFYEAFSCLADRCKCTCCQGWEILLSRAEYNKTKNTRKSADLQRRVDAGVKRCKNRNSDSLYAEMQFNENGVCTLLNEQGMCSLQLECGYNTLSYTCKVFPRTQVKAPGGLQRTCSTGCEQVLNLMLELPGVLQFVEREVEAPDKIIHLEPSAESRPAAAFFPRIQALCIAILQNRRYTLDDRMILLGLALKDLDAAEQAGPEALEAWLRQKGALLAMEPEDVRKSLGDLPSNEELCVFSALGVGKLISPVVFPKLEDNLYSRMFAVCRELLDVKFLENDVCTYDSNRYAKVRAAYEEQLTKWPHLMEHIMVNAFFAVSYPITDEKMWMSYMAMCSIYNFFRLMAMCSYARQLNQEDLKQALVLCSRMFFHSKGARQMLWLNSETTHSNTLAHMAMLIKG